MDGGDKKKGRSRDRDRDRDGDRDRDRDRDREKEKGRDTERKMYGLSPPTIEYETVLFFISSPTPPRSYSDSNSLFDVEGKK